MQRRKFLSLLGVGAVTAPVSAKAVADTAFADLKMAKMGISGAGLIAPAGPQSTSSGISWAKPALKKFIGKSARQKQMEAKRQWVDALDPQVATLRSVSLHSKIRMTRRTAYERSQEAERTWLEGVIAGWWE